MITSLSVNTGGLGRAGNTMFTIASTIGIAIKNGHSFLFPQWIIKDNELFGQKADVMDEYFVNPLPRLLPGIEADLIHEPYHWEYKDYRFADGKNYNIQSHLQDPRYFQDYMPLIRHYFRMKDEPFQNDNVAIHYRAGDYIDDAEAYHPRCSKEYYEQALSMFPTGTKFELYTDDKETAIALFKEFDREICIVLNQSYLMDFADMKRCKSFITANSSFSAMAAILGEHPEKKIIMPKRWFGKQANGLQSYIYPKGAIIL